MDDDRHDSHDSTPGTDSASCGVLGGLSVAADGLRLSAATMRFAPGEPVDWEFRVLGPDGEAVTAFEESHGRVGHLVVVRRDLTRFQHRHPTLDADGTWRVERFELPASGVYRAFFDGAVGGRSTTLGVDLFVPGSMDVAPRPAAERRGVDGAYEVELLTDELDAGEPADLAFEIRREGVPVSHLDPYLGALGHLVALREGDLAYLHVHPIATGSDGGRVQFRTRFPTAGRYRLFLQANPEGTLITTRHDVRIEN